MSPRGKTPSLIGGGAGRSRFVRAKKKRTCKRCNQEILKGSWCAEVGIPGSMGSKTYCTDCYRNILEQSKRVLASLERQLAFLA